MDPWTAAPTAFLLLSLGTLCALLLVVARQRGLAGRVETLRLDQVVAQRIVQLTELAHHLQTAREDERARLARDLHDELGALLTSAKLDAARIRSRLAGSAPEALERLAHLGITLDAVIAIKRRITEDLMPSSLAHLGLVSALENLARDFAEASGAQVHCALLPVPMDSGVELTVYRLVQEALTNTGKHAGATQVWVSLGPAGTEAEVTVRDDGNGFDADAGRGGAYGLVGMRFRVEADQGSLAVTSNPGQGTCVRARLPQRIEAVAAAA